MSEPTMSQYSAALDEIWRLRRALAYEARVVEAHTGFATFPKSRRAIAHEQVRRMQAAARGEVEVVYAGTSRMSLDQAMTDAGAERTLTRYQFEQEKARGGEAA